MRRWKAVCLLVTAALLFLLAGCRKAEKVREANWSAGEFLTDAGNGVFLKVEVVLVVSSEEAAKELEKAKPIVRDEVLRAIRTIGPELPQPGGTEKLAEEVKRRMDGMLRQGKVVSVLFPQFVTQVVK